VKITESPTFRANLLAKIAAREFAERTGVHCSDLLYCLNKQAMRRLHPEEPTDSELLLYSLGWSTQAWISGKFVDSCPVEKDGIIVTCDAVVCPCCGVIIE